MERADEKRIRAEREHVRGQVDLFGRKFKQFDTIWHTTLERLDKTIAEIEKKKKGKKKKKVTGGPLPKDRITIVGEPGPETIKGDVLPKDVSKKIKKENYDG